MYSHKTRCSNYFSYLQSLTNSMNLQSQIDNSSSNERKLCRQQSLSSEEDQFSSFHMHHPHAPSLSPNYSYSSNVSIISNEYIKDQENVNDNTIALSSYRYVFVMAQILHGIGASALISLGVTYLDESVDKRNAPVFIGIFEASFVLGPAIG